MIHATFMFVCSNMCKGSLNNVKYIVAIIFYVNKNYYYYSDEIENLDTLKKHAFLWEIKALFGSTFSCSVFREWVRTGRKLVWRATSHSFLEKQCLRTVFDNFRCAIPVAACMVGAFHFFSYCRPVKNRIYFMDPNISPSSPFHLSPFALSST